MSVARTLTPYERDALVTQGPVEIIDPRLADVEALARWLDYAFVLPGGFRFGLAGIVGLIPGIGDLIDAIISLYIVGRAVQLQIPRVAIARMTANVGIEAVAGAIPLAGDLFDIAFKANRRNYRILKSYIAEPSRQQGKDWFFVIGLGLFLAVLASLSMFGLFELIRLISTGIGK